VSVDRLLVVGHNPTFEQLVSHLVSRQVTMPTGALALVVLAVQQWGQIDDGTRGALVGLFDPEMLKKKPRLNPP
jgi:phosphohistidine phosphatase SixA